ncbi:hemagglutinin repeat-containing protein [Veillonella caviae]|uniref:hemagglutinin repeat-containing protein n=1 Tax=Veillonella caviae TaxID=248316 RepID=UPI001F49B00B|nr:hemagglutinin repeat-containing protein [Veillonella caviae]
MTLDGRDTLHNIGGTIEGIGKGIIRSKDYQNKNSSFTAKRVSPEIEKGLSGASNDAMLTEQENQILITDKNHSEHGQTFKESEFSSLNSGYGANHNRGNTAPMPIYDAAEYVTIEQITPEEQAAGEETIPAEYIGTQVPSYAYDDPIFQEFGITSMTTERPQAAGPEQEAWDAQFKPILASLNDKIKVHNEKAKLYNQQISGVANEKIDDYTIIRTKTMTSNEEVKNSTPGVVRFGGDVSFTGNGTNENSQMVVGGTLTTMGAINQVAKENQEVTNIFGTTEASYTYKRKWPHKSRRRGYKGQVFMTPQVNKENPISLGVAKKEDKNGKAKGEVGANHRKEVQDFLNPFAQDSSNDVSKPTAGTNILALPTESLYRIHPESTANYVVETDPQFTNKKVFLSSDYMYKEMKTKPENIEKRLGDGLYEQTLVRNQIVSGTGYRFLDGYTDDESQFKALMDAGIVYAKQHGIVPGVALTAEQAASLTSDMVWLVKDVVMVEGKPVEVIYPKVYLKQSDRLQLHTDGTLISANTLVMNAKKRIHNEGVIQGKTVVLASDQDIINSGHINADKVGLQSDTIIYQQGQIVGRDAVGLQAKENITFNNSIEHLTNQDVLHKTAGIAVTGDTGVMIVSAGNDVNLGGATIEALGKEGAITITAGRDINSTTDTLTGKKDMTQDGDNYLRTYRQTELGTTIEAGGDISIGAKHDIKARNLTVSSDSGAVKVIGEHDVSIENGYSDSKDVFALKYKEKGLLNKKETKIKTNDESKNALMSTLSGHTVVVGANNDVTLTSSNIVSTAGTSVLAGHNVITDAAAEHTLSTASKDVKKSGIMGAGMGIMIGKKQSKDNYYIDETTHKATTLGSTDGEVTVQAGDTVHLTTTNAVGKDGVVIVAQDIILDGKDDVYKQEERHERKSSGLTVSLGGSVVEKIDSAVKKQHSASDRRNSRFKSLEGKQSIDRLLFAIGEAKQIVDRSYNGQMRAINSQLERVNADIVNTPETDSTKLAELKAKQELLLKKRTTLEENKGIVDRATDRAVDRAVNIQVGIGSSKSVAESKLERYTYSSGAIDSDGTILLHANSADSIKGNITAIGEQIKGKTVQLTASNTINLEAGSNTQRVETNSKSSGWNVSANIGMRTGGLVGWSASAYKGTENGIEDSTIHTGTHVVGSNKVSITSGNDTNLTGSTISGKSVTANVGNNLTVESLQDSQIYHETSKSKGLSISGANFISQPTINGINVKGNIDSTYTSVTEQSGIHAGSDGMNLAVGNMTTLKGATITSKATPEKNKMSTKSLVMEDIHNEASYKAKKSGIAMNASGLTAKGVLGKINPLGLSPVVSIPVSDEVQSTTKSAISDDILVEVEHKPLTTINRDTEHALNSIKPIFDKADVKERMEYVNAVSDEGFKLIGDIAMKQAQKYEEKAAITTDEALKKRYQKEADKWKDGGIYKVALHGGFGAVVSNMAGGSSLEGFTVSSANEVMVGAIAKELAKHPNSTADANGKYVDNSDVYKIASAILGNTVSHSSLGAGISLSATQNNYLTHEQIKLYKQEYSKAKSNEEREAIDAKWQKIYFQQAREILDEMYALHNKIIKDEVGVNNPSKVSEYYNAVRALFARHGYYFKMGDLPTLDLNENGYRGYKSSFKTFGLPRNGRSSIFKSIGIRRYYDKDLTPLDREKLGFVKRNENITPKTIIKPGFVWTKDDLGKSVAQNVLSEVGNQPWVGYVYYAENASKFTRTVAKVGGPVSIGFLLNDMRNDYQMYSGRELVKAWSANLIPVGLGIGGGFVGGFAAGPAGAFAIGVTGATLGDRVKDEIKFNLKKDVDK